ncbi:iron ABC transporter permease [Streptomyces sp. A0592]|uniref:FecCD family ABC transporter permease n=1 Tax=Streptomyces sp. A0592 TaxID=2563099 RepID=UPI00109E7B49|nr:iron ABC transporter permease [Streptomyces sp. A0592]THA75402.1 iron ABC transporter permease [Streptomyces sp. A0592]
MSTNPVITGGSAPFPAPVEDRPGSTAAVRRDGPAATAALLAASRRAATRRFAAAWVLTVVLLLALLVASVLMGGLRNIPAGDVLPAAFGLRTGLADYVVHRIRLPRALAALLGGALFGLAGALYQRLIRNPLATPDVVGISAGAGAGAVTVLLLAPAIPYGVEGAAVAGAFAMVAAVLALSRQSGRVDTYRLVVIGIGLAAVATAYTNYLFTMAGEQGLAQVMRWLVGSVSGATWDGVTTLAVALAVCGICTALLYRPLASMSLGDELASGLGTRVGAARTAALLLGAGAAALATSVTGPIGFVSLVSGPVAARLVGTERALALAPAVGAAIVLGADVLAQHGPLISPVPTGAVTALIGAPYFVLLILRRGQGAPS